MTSNSSAAAHLVNHGELRGGRRFHGAGLAACLVPDRHHLCFGLGIALATASRRA